MVQVILFAEQVLTTYLSLYSSSIRRVPRKPARKRQPHFRLRETVRKLKQEIQTNNIREQIINRQSAIIRRGISKIETRL